MRCKAEYLGGEVTSVRNVSKTSEIFKVSCDQQAVTTLLDLKANPFFCDRYGPEKKKQDFAFFEAGARTLCILVSKKKSHGPAPIQGHGRILCWDFED